ncbi:MAG TPA: hypothetical protein VMP01_24360 [Pirellulaceae bacterium]|nr:hypothetical protein [Pirellulaceae bacterium]
MNGHFGTWMLAAAAVLAGTNGWTRLAEACPGCEPTGTTFSDEMAVMDAVVVARLLAPGAQAGNVPSTELLPSPFEIVRVLKGDALVRTGGKLETLYLGSGQPGSLFLIMGIAQPKMMWSKPHGVSERVLDYLAKLVQLPQEGVERYRFVLDYLEDEESDLARDAYDEFAKAPYAAVRSLKDDLDHDEIVARIDNPGIPATRRRLYFVMLGIVGDDKDVPYLEALMQSADRQDRRGLDMIIFCYLSIRGESGLPMIEERFLRNQDCDYSDTYAAIMALRMHAAEEVTLQPKHVVGPLRGVLERPQLADLVIPDLARWEDWTAIDKLLELYKTADEKSSWVRVPVVNYLRACPLPRAKALIAECEKIDPQAVKRAHSFFPSLAPPAAAEKAAEKATGNDNPRRNAPQFVSTAADAVPATFQAPIPQPQADESEESAAVPAAQASAVQPNTAGTSVASINPGAAPAKALKTAAAVRPNLWLLLGVPLLSGAALWMLQSSILRGRIGRG